MNKKTKDLVMQNVLLLIPILVYGVYKNGYLIYQKSLINGISILKPLFLVLISILIKVITDIIRFKKINIDYDFVHLILIAMIMPYNINYIVYSISVIFFYIISLILKKYFKFNMVCFIYLVTILINFLINEYTFKTPLELNYNFSFSFLNLLMGRSVGGIASTSILFSLIAYIVLLNNFYYKKDIALTINISYLFLAAIYFLITKNKDLLINSDLVFASIFISSLPLYSPYKQKNQILYSILIGILTFILSIYFNSIISIYLSTFIVSLGLNISISKKVKENLYEKN